MLDVSATGELLLAILIAMVAGGLGGIVSELLLERGKSRTTGVLMLPDRNGNRVELGSAAAIIIGLAAGVAAAALLVPTDDVVVKEVTETQVDILRVIGVSLVAGAAGQAFWAAITKGLTATDYNARITSLLRVLEEEKKSEAGGGPRGGGLDAAIAALEEAQKDTP